VEVFAALALRPKSFLGTDEGQPRLAPVVATAPTISCSKDGWCGPDGGASIIVPAGGEQRASRALMAAGFTAAARAPAMLHRRKPRRER